VGSWDGFKAKLVSVKGRSRRYWYGIGVSGLFLVMIGPNIGSERNEDSLHSVES